MPASSALTDGDAARIAPADAARRERLNFVADLRQRRPDDFGQNEVPLPPAVSTNAGRPLTADEEAQVKAFEAQPITGRAMKKLFSLDPRVMMQEHFDLIFPHLPESVPAARYPKVLCKHMVALCNFSGQNPEAMAATLLGLILDHGGTDAKVTILPMAYESEDAIQRSALIRVDRADGATFFLDDKGHNHESFSDFLHNNELPRPNCRMVVPMGGRWQRDEAGHVRLYDGYARYETPFEMASREIHLDSMVTAAAFTLGFTTAVAGSALPGLVTIGTGLTALSMAAAVYKIYDHGAHGRGANPVTNPEVRADYLGFFGGGLGFLKNLPAKSEALKSLAEMGLAVAGKASELRSADESTKLNAKQKEEAHVNGIIDQAGSALQAIGSVLGPAAKAALKGRGGG